MDLCYGLGLKPGEFADPRFSEALGAILASCKKHGKVAGMFGYTPELAATALEQGFVFASVGTDISFLREGTTGALKRAGFDPEQKESAGY
jgi:4-hydroxy-2-oxoheptanedioate aldolase